MDRKSSRKIDTPKLNEKFPPLRDNLDFDDKFAEIDISSSETHGERKKTGSKVRFEEISITKKSDKKKQQYSELEGDVGGDDDDDGNGDNDSFPDPKYRNECSIDSPDRFIDIQIESTRKIGEGISAYVVYEIGTHTNLRHFKNRHVRVMRRFSDFLGLHSKLSEKYLKLGRVIPPPPEKKVITSTKIKFVEQEADIDAFIEKRKMLLVRFLRRIAEHPVLLIDCDFVQFLETVDELPKANNTSALSGAGVFRFLNKFGETVNKITSTMDEKDEWFTLKLQQIETLEAQYHRINDSLETMVQQTVELSQTTSSVAKSIATLSSVEENVKLSKALTKLSDVEEHVEHLHIRQAKNDYYGLAELFKEYIGLFGAIRETFNERVKLYRLCEHSQMMLTRNEEARARFDSPTDRTDALDSEIFDWQTKVQRANDNFDRISTVIKAEVERFEANRIEEFQRVLALYLRNHIDSQNEIIRAWENFLSETKLVL